MKQITIAGRVTKNAEVKQFDTNSVVNFSVAVDDGYGENKSTLFFDCEYYRTGIADYLVKENLSLYKYCEQNELAWGNRYKKLLNENDICQPVNPYGNTKLFIENQR